MTYVQSYTTYENILHDMWQKCIQHVEKYYTAYKKLTENIWHIVPNIWLQIRQRIITNQATYCVQYTLYRC